MLTVAMRRRTPRRRVFNYRYFAVYDATWTRRRYDRRRKTSLVVVGRNEFKQPPPSDGTLKNHHIATFDLTRQLET